MSTDSVESPSEVQEVQPPQVARSLKDRLEQRRHELEHRTTEKFPIPQWSSVLAVELKAVNWKTSARILRTNQRATDEDTGMLRSMGDELVAATVAFYEIPEEGDQDLAPVEAQSWREIAEAAGKSIPEGVNDRVALVALCGEQGVVALSAAYRMWLSGAEGGISKEMERDF